MKLQSQSQTRPLNSRRRRAPVILVVNLALLAAVMLIKPRPVTVSTLAQKAAKPNVLIIAVDDLNHWVRHLGRNKQVITPNIDGLAARGVTFANAYCAAPICNPSRAALLSGLRPSTSGVYNNNDDWRPQIPSDKTLVTHFRQSGYYSIASYGVEQLQRKHDKPFLLTIGFRKPHMPWNAPKKYFDMYPLDKIELPAYREDDLNDIPPSGVKMARGPGSNSPDKPSDHDLILKSGRWKEAVQAYLATITYVDGQIGRVLDALDKTEYRDNTIIVFWGDHGWSLGEKHHWRKFALWEEPTRAPLIWVAPGVTKAGTTSTRTVDFMSVYPTLSELCGLPIPAHVEGASIKKLLADPGAKWDRPALTTHGYQNHAVRSAQWRYIRYEDGGEELYDETKDPYEWTNLANDKKYDKVKAKLAKEFPKVNNHGSRGGNASGGEGDGPRNPRPGNRRPNQNNE